MSEKIVQIYGTIWCPDCHRTKAFFQAHGVPFEWFDIEKDAEALKRVREIDANNKRVPVVVYPDGEVLIEPSNADLQRKQVASAP